MLYEWKWQRSVYLLSYNLLSSLTDKEGSTKTTQGELVWNSLLDEGHFLRNKDNHEDLESAHESQEANTRIVLSSTLFQNNFENLFNTLFVRPDFVEAFSSYDLGASSNMLGSECDKKLADEELAMDNVRIQQRALKLKLGFVQTNVKHKTLWLIRLFLKFFEFNVWFWHISPLIHFQKLHLRQPDLGGNYMAAFCGMLLKWCGMLQARSTPTKFTSPIYQPISKEEAHDGENQNPQPNEHDKCWVTKMVVDQIYQAQGGPL